MVVISKRRSVSRRRKKGIRPDFRGGDLKETVFSAAVGFGRVMAFMYLIFGIAISSAMIIIGGVLVNRNMGFTSTTGTVTKLISACTDNPNVYTTTCPSGSSSTSTCIRINAKDCNLMVSYKDSAGVVHEAQHLRTENRTYAVGDGIKVFYRKSDPSQLSRGRATALLFWLGVGLIIGGALVLLVAIVWFVAAMRSQGVAAVTGVVGAVDMVRS